MKLLVDTQLVLWALEDSSRLSSEARRWLNDPQNELYFSIVSIWEVAIKQAIKRPNLPPPRAVRTALLGAQYRELPITSEHAIAVATLPSIHRDPFDRLLAAQAGVEGFVLLTADAELAQYPGAKRV